MLPAGGGVKEPGVGGFRARLSSSRTADHDALDASSTNPMLLSATADNSTELTMTQAMAAAEHPTSPLTQLTQTGFASLGGRPPMPRLSNSDATNLHGFPRRFSQKSTPMAAAGAQSVMRVDSEQLGSAARPSLLSPGIASPGVVLLALSTQPSAQNNVLLPRETGSSDRLGRDSTLGSGRGGEGLGQADRPLRSGSSFLDVGAAAHSANANNASFLHQDSDSSFEYRSPMLGPLPGAVNAPTGLALDLAGGLEAISGVTTGRSALSRQTGMGSTRSARFKPKPITVADSNLKEPGTAAGAGTTKPPILMEAMDATAGRPDTYDAIGLRTGISTTSPSTHFSSVPTPLGNAGNAGGTGGGVQASPAGSSDPGDPASRRANQTSQQQQQHQQLGQKSPPPPPHERAPARKGGILKRGSQEPSLVSPAGGTLQHHTTVEDQRPYSSASKIPSHPSQTQATAATPGVGVLLSPKNKAFLAPMTPKTPFRSRSMFEEGSEEVEEKTVTETRFRRFSSHAGEAVRSCWSRISIRELAARCIDSYAFNILIFFLTLFSIFSDDIRLATVTRQDDAPFFGVSAGILAVYLFEFVISCTVRDRYRWNFYFWLELMATVSLITDIGWIWTPILDNYINAHPRLDRGTVLLTQAELNSVDGGLSGVLVNCGRDTPCIRGHSTSEFLVLAERVVRLFRYVRVVKLYKALKKGFVAVCSSASCCAICFPRSRSLSDSGDSQTSVDSTGIQRFTSPLAKAAHEFSGLFALGGASGFDTATAKLLEATEPLNANIRRRRSSYAADSASTLQRFPSQGDGLQEAQETRRKPIQRVGTKLSDLTTRRIVLFILIVMFVSPLLESSSAALEFAGEGTSRLMQLWLLHRRPQDLNVTMADYKFEVQSFALNNGRVAMLDICSTVNGAASGCTYPPPLSGVRDWLVEAATFQAYDRLNDIGRLVSSTNDSMAPVVAESYHGIASSEWDPSDIVNSRAAAVANLRPTEYQYYETYGCFSESGMPSNSRRLRELVARPFLSINPAGYARELAAADSSSCHSFVIFNAQHEAQRRAWFAIGRSLFAILFIGLGAVVFTRDAQALVVRHIERMVQMMRALRRNPLQPLDKLHSQLKQSQGTSNQPNGQQRRGSWITALLTPHGAGVVSPQGTPQPGPQHFGGRNSISLTTVPNPESPERGSRGLSRMYTAAGGMLRSVASRVFRLGGRSAVAPQDVNDAHATADVAHQPILNTHNIGTFYGRRHLSRYAVAPAPMAKGEDAGGTALEGRSMIASPSEPVLMSAHSFAIAGGGDGRLRRVGTGVLTSRFAPPPPPPSCTQKSRLCCWRLGSKYVFPALRCVGRRFSSWFCTNHDDVDSYETLLLETTIIKVGGLLQIGFGEAGRDIIAKNMQGHGVLKPMVNGSRVDAVFGFCDVRQFTDVTECLQEEVMVFVNKIGRIVHSATHRLNGAPNKNIGDAFLLVWKLPPIPRDRHGNPLKTRGTNRIGGQSPVTDAPPKDANPQLPTKRTSLLKALGLAATFTKTTMPPLPGTPLPENGRPDAQPAEGDRSSTGRRASSQPPPQDESGSGSARNRWTPSMFRSRSRLASGGPAELTIPGPVDPATGTAVAARSIRIVNGIVHTRNSSAPSIVLASVAEAFAQQSSVDSPNPPKLIAPQQARVGVHSLPPPRSKRISGESLVGSSSKLNDSSFGISNTEIADSHATITAHGSQRVDARKSPADPQISVVIHVAEDNSPNDPAPPVSTSNANLVHDTSPVNTSAQSQLTMHMLNVASSVTHQAGSGSDKGVHSPEIKPVIERIPEGRDESQPGGRSPILAPLSMSGAVVGGSAYARHLRKSTVVDSVGPQGRRPSMSAFRKEDLARRADQALAAFLKIIVDINRANTNPKDSATDLQIYQRHREIAQRFNHSYSVKMGFGLHIGWAIEGAIGSKYKVDASYLSPHVNLAARLEAATKQYSVPLLISHDFATQLSEPASTYLRLIDCVTVKGSSEPMKLYTFDIFDYPDDFGEDPLMNWDRAADAAAHARSEGAMDMAESMLFHQDRDDPAGMAGGSLPEEEGPPADFKIKLDFSRDPAVRSLQSIRRGLPGWNFPDEDTMLAMYRAKRGLRRGTAATFMEESVHTMPEPYGSTEMGSPDKKLKNLHKASNRNAAMLSFEASPVEETGEDDDDNQTVAESSEATLQREKEDAEKDMCEEMVHRFFDKFNDGVVAYIIGDWAGARRNLYEVLALKSDDGPTHTLLRVMDDLCEGGPGGPAPVGWRRYRELTEK